MFWTAFPLFMSKDYINLSLTKNDIFDRKTDDQFPNPAKNGGLINQKTVFRP